MSTANFYIGERDYWIQIANAPGEVQVTSSPSSHPYYVWAGPIGPSAADEGILVCGKFQTYNQMSDVLYARVINPVSTASRNDGKLRLDVFTIANGPSSGSGLFLEDGSSFLLLEDGSSFLLLE